MKSIYDHAQIAYRRCNICKRTYAATENGKVLIIPVNVVIRDGIKRSKAPHFTKICQCGGKVNVRAHHQVIPCIGDMVRFPISNSGD